jgi:hypothetical protein
MSEPAETGLRVLLFAGFAVFWVFIVRRVARTSGWRDLATSYRAIAPFHGRKRCLQSGYVGGVSHGGSLILGADADGLYMSVLAPSRFGHQPLYIPWSDVAVHGEKRAFINFSVLTFAKHPNATLRTYLRTARRLATWSAGRLTISTSTDNDRIHH